MNIARFTKTVEKLIVDNSPVILTAVGVVGTVATAYLTHKAAVTSTRVIDSLSAAREGANEQDGIVLAPFSNKEKAKLVWKEYVPPVAVGAGTIAAIVFSNRISTRRAAALAAAYSVSERAYSEYKDKVVEKLGVKKDQDVRDEVAQDRMTKDPVSAKTVIITDGGEVLCYDKMSGRYFKSSMESIKAAVNDTNYQILQDGYQCLSDFYERLGLDIIGFSEEVGWNHETKLEPTYSTAMSDDGRPCIVIDYDLSPNRKYAHLAQ